MKILIYICIISSFLFGYNVSHGKCEIDIEASNSVAGMVDNCFKDNETLVIQAGNLVAGNNTNTLIRGYIANLGQILGVIAILMLVYSGFLLVLSGGDEEKIKKGKDLFKWTIIGFIALVSAGGIISLLIFTIYEFGAMA